MGGSQLDNNCFSGSLQRTVEHYTGLKFLFLFSLVIIVCMIVQLFVVNKYYYSYKICLHIIFKSLKGLASAYLADLCVSTTVVPGRSGLRSAVQGDLVVPGHRTEWGSISFAEAGPKYWNKLPV